MNIQNKTFADTGEAMSFFNAGVSELTRTVLHGLPDKADFGRANFGSDEAGITLTRDGGQSTLEAIPDQHDFITIPANAECVCNLSGSPRTCDYVICNDDKQPTQILVVPSPDAGGGIETIGTIGGNKCILVTITLKPGEKLRFDDDVRLKKV
jgi:hypothetical protein